MSFHAYVAANCWNVLAKTPRVDASRIAIVGHSYGGKWALFAAALWEKAVSPSAVAASNFNDLRIKETPHLICDGGYQLEL